MAAMNDTAKTFFAIGAILFGAIILLQLPYNGFFWDHAGEAFFGVLFVAGGITYFLKRKSTQI